MANQMTTACTARGRRPGLVTHAESRFAKRRQHQVRNNLLKVHDAPFFRRRIEDCETALQVAREDSVGDIGEGGGGYEGLDGVTLGAPVLARREEDAEGSVQSRRGEVGWWDKEASDSGASMEWGGGMMLFSAWSARERCHTLFLRDVRRMPRRARGR